MHGAGRQADTLGQKMSAALSPRNLAAGLGIGVGIAQVSELIGGAISDASDLAESMSKVDVVFGESAKEVQEWASTAASAMGQSKQAALEAAGTYGNLFQAFGIGREKATEMSMTLVELATDLASFNNTSVEDAILALRSGLSGETEPLKRYGVAISDVRLRQEALSLGLIQTTNEVMPPAIKAQATYSLILKDTALAQGDFARTSDGLANQQRILAAKLEDVSAELGEKLLPVMVELVTFLSEEGIPVLQEFLGLLDFENKNSADSIPVLKEIEDFLNFVSGAGAKRGGILGDMWNFDPRIEAAAKQLGLTYEEMGERVQLVMERTGRSHDEAIGHITSALEPLPHKVADVLYDTSAKLREGGADIDTAAVDMADGVPAAMEDAKEAAEEVARQTPGALANQLRAGIEEYDEAIDELADVAANSISDLAERQKIEGILASQVLTDALNSDSTRTRLLAQELVSDLVSDYELLEPGALAAGALVNPALQSGVNSNIQLAYDAGQAVVDAAGNPLVDTQWAYDAGLKIPAMLAKGMDAGGLGVWQAAMRMASSARGVYPDSEPKDPRSPFRGLIQSGEMVGERFAMGIRNASSLVTNELLAMAGMGALKAGTTAGTGSFGTLGSTGGGQVGGNSYNVQLVDRMEVRTVEDIGYGLKRLGDLGKLPGSKR